MGREIDNSFERKAMDKLNAPLAASLNCLTYRISVLPRRIGTQAFDFLTFSVALPLNRVARKIA